MNQRYDDAPSCESDAKNEQFPAPATEPLDPNVPCDQQDLPQTVDNAQFDKAQADCSAFAKSAETNKSSEFVSNLDNLGTSSNSELGENNSPEAPQLDTPAPKTLTQQAYDEEEVSPVRRPDPQLFELSAKEAERQLGHSYSRKFLPLALLALVLLSLVVGAFVGNHLGNQLELSTDVASYKQNLRKLTECAGYFADMGIQYAILSTALWFALSSFAGGLALIIPVDVYYIVGRSHIKAKQASSAVSDLLKGEFYKYGLVILLLGFFLKETTLYAPVLITTFVVLAFVAMLLQLFTLPQPSAEFLRYMYKKRQQEQSQAFLAQLKEQAAESKQQED